MLTGMRHTIVLLLGYVLAVAGCGGGPPDTEIEGSVQATVAKERAAVTLHSGLELIRDELARSGEGDLFNRRMKVA